MKRNPLWNEWPMFFDDFFGRDLFDGNLRNFSGTGATLPAVNILEKDDSFEVEMAAPGLKRENFQVALDNNLLTISSHWEEESEETGEKDPYSRREFSYRDFQRSFRLPSDVVDIEHIEAHYKDGLLAVRIPKREEAKKLAPRVIEID
jgi:HSP20 family protein